MSKYNKKILFIPGIVEKPYGGAEIQAKYIAEGLHKIGYKISGIYIRPEYHTPIYEGLSLHRNKLFKKLRGNSFFIKKIYKYIKQINPDFIYCRAFIPQSLAPAVYYSRQYNCKSIWHIASNRFVEKFRVDSFKHLPLEFIDNLLLKYGIRNVDYIISQTVYLQDCLLRNHNRRANQIFPNFHPIPKYEFQKNKTVQIVWVANFKKIKQPELFIKLAAGFSKHSDIKFIMVGAPAQSEWMNHIREEIANLPNLIWLGKLPLDEVNQVLAVSHLFVNTSVAEGFPNTFIQAWMHKVPVLSLHADIDGVLEDGKIGSLCYTFENLMQRTKHLIENESKRNEMGLNAQLHAFKNYSLEANMQKIQTAFEID